MKSPNAKPQTIITLIILSSHLFTLITTQYPHHLLHSPATSDPNQRPTTTTESEAQEFLKAHNQARLHLGQPTFKWDPELESFARAFADKRAADCHMIHSYGPYGENIFWGGGNRWTPSDVVRSWVREHRYYNRATMDCEPGKMCGHYTQIVWRDSLKLGCALVECQHGGVFAICEYDPPGNYVGESPFKLYDPDG